MFEKSDWKVMNEVIDDSRGAARDAEREVQKNSNN